MHRSFSIKLKLITLQTVRFKWEKALGQDFTKISLLIPIENRTLVALKGMNLKDHLIRYNWCLYQDPHLKADSLKKKLFCSQFKK